MGIWREISIAIAKGLLKQLPILGGPIEEVFIVLEKKKEKMTSALNISETLIDDASVAIPEEEKEKLAEKIKEIAKSPEKSKSEIAQNIAKVIEKESAKMISNHESAVKRAKLFPEPARSLVLYLLENWIEAKEAQTGIFVYREGRSIIQIREAKQGVHFNIFSQPPMNPDNILAIFDGNGERKKTAIQVPIVLISKEKIDALLDMIRQCYAKGTSAGEIIERFVENNKAKVQKMLELWPHHKIGNKFIFFMDEQQQTVFRVCPDVIHVYYRQHIDKASIVKDFSGEEKKSAIRIELDKLSLEKIDALVAALR